MWVFTSSTWLTTTLIIQYYEENSLHHHVKKCLRIRKLGRFINFFLSRHHNPNLKLLNIRNISLCYSKFPTAKKYAQHIIIIAASTLTHKSSVYSITIIIKKIQSKIAISDTSRLVFTGSIDKITFYLPHNFPL